MYGRICNKHSVRRRLHLSRNHAPENQIDIQLISSSPAEDQENVAPPHPNTSTQLPTIRTTRRETYIQNLGDWTNIGIGIRNVHDWQLRREEDDDCPFHDCLICMGVIDNGRDRSDNCITCGKYFHKACLCSWFYHSNTRNCPHCRGHFTVDPTSPGYTPPSSPSILPERIIPETPQHDVLDPNSNEVINYEELE